MVKVKVCHVFFSSKVALVACIHILIYLQALASDVVLLFFQDSPLVKGSCPLYDLCHILERYK